MSKSPTEALLERHRLPYEIKRNKLGQYAPGQTGNPGGATNIAIRSTRFYMRLLTEAVDRDTFLAVVNRVVQDALNGTASAQKLLFHYLIGPAMQAFMLLAKEQTVIMGDRKQAITQVLAILGPLASAMQESSGTDSTE